MGRRAARGLVRKQESHLRYRITDFPLRSSIIQDSKKVNVEVASMSNGGVWKCESDGEREGAREGGREIEAEGQ